MYNSGLTRLKKLYDQWNIQGFVLLSLWLQSILILFAPLKKRTRSWIVVLLSLVAYLVADWAVSVAVGLITYSQKEIHDQHGSRKFPNDEYADILAFWAPFLLLHHLPEQDSAGLWQRQFIGLLNRVVSAFTVFSQSLPRNRLSVPTILLFVAGTLKYGERTYALFQANPNKLRQSMVKAPGDPGPNYEKIMDAYSASEKAKLPTQLELCKEPKTARYAAEDEGPLDDDLKAVEHAYHFFQIFKGLIVDLILSFRVREESRLFFHKRTPVDAFRVLAVELNFMYEVFYTKAAVVHLMFGHLVVRFISWFAVVAALSIFYTIDKHDFRKIDVEISYTLFFGALGLDIIALVMLALSDWTAASIVNSPRRNFCIEAIKGWLLFLLRYYLKLKRINWGENKPSCLEYGARQVLLRRWSESLNQYNLIHYCLKERPNKKRSCFDCFCRMVIYLFNLKDFYDTIKYVSNKPFEEKLWEFIFVQLKKKSELADEPETAKRICSARGEWVLQNNDWTTEGSSKLMHYIVDVDFDQSLILWHIATDLCYLKNSDTDNQRDDESDSRREFCKTLSDYMLYLLIMQPTMMSAVAGIGEIRFRDTCAEAIEFFTRKEPTGENDKAQEKYVCEMILKVNTDVEPVAVKGDRSKSVLFDACILAKELNKLDYKKRWGIMSEVWVELLSYAASHCRPNTHVAQLSKGGELITFVWLLMAHFGLGDRFQISEGHAIAKLIVGK
ncbi:uncharacterized protein LOC132169959 [Corylus avellana]|uniref:uncharacterized protein LOC132169959 n=1 Tax=Corylus avellana TaxID=13451 RepID=UPI00286A7AC2|nr:uncharacterized protein LOC132169959 [Corylus avellana]